MPDTSGTAPAPPPDLATLRATLPLPTTDSTPSAANPWADDLLDRASLADNLTNFIRPQREPLVVSLHGDWGSGKTFFLKRWVRTLEDRGFPTFYYNAWEDDYAPAPLIPILTKLEATTKNGQTRRRLRQAALPFLIDVTTSALRAQTGVDLRQSGDLTSLLKDDAVFDAYRKQRTHRTQLRDALASLAKSASKKSGHPTVCIIDELDRCRPTFAIELLETTKHVFDVDGLVFVLALNRAELAKSICSLYGQIDADTYLRRFFDVHLTLPAADTIPYTLHLFSRFHLDTFFEKLSAIAQSDVHNKDYGTVTDFLPSFWLQLGLSLRDIHHCVASLSIVCRSLEPRHYLFPAFLATLLVVRHRAPGLYHQFASGGISPGRVVDEILSWVRDTHPADRRFDNLSSGLEIIEGCFYATHGDAEVRRDEDAITQLSRVAEGNPPEYPHLLSNKTLNGGIDRAKRILNQAPTRLPFGHQHAPFGRAGLQYLLRLIDLLSDPDGKSP